MLSEASAPVFFPVSGAAPAGANSRIDDVAAAFCFFDGFASRSTAARGAAGTAGVGAVVPLRALAFMFLGIEGELLVRHVLALEWNLMPLDIEVRKREARDVVLGSEGRRAGRQSRRFLIPSPPARPGYRARNFRPARSVEAAFFMRSISTLPIASLTTRRWHCSLVFRKMLVVGIESMTSARWP